MNESYRIPPESVDSIARGLRDLALPFPLLVWAARRAVADGMPGDARRIAEQILIGLLQPVINATGVLLHTNLGRAPLRLREPEKAIRYSNLELDLLEGRRGSRQRSIGFLLARLTGAESALVVNNGAGALLVALAALAANREVVISRGELIEIGGGFRIPEVITTFGSKLIEVGSTNRTRLADYQRAVGSDTAAIVKIHKSNFRITGFHEEVSVSELSSLGIPLIVDLGSGLLDAECSWLPGRAPTWLAQEPAVRQTLSSGADIVTFSGDKLFGGPQAGIVVGRQALVEACANHPLARALRPGGTIFDDLQATALAYLRKQATHIPFWEMASRDVADLRNRATAIGFGKPTELQSVIGGGSLPGIEIPSFGLTIPGDQTVTFRRWEPPIIARVQNKATVLDLRTVDPLDDSVIRAAIQSCE